MLRIDILHILLFSKKISPFFSAQPILRPVHKLVHEIVRFSQDCHLFSPGDRIIVGVSGGADSTALLHILASGNLQLRLTAVYIDHGLRPDETPSERTFVQRLAAEVGADFLWKAVAVREHRQEHGLSLEESARILRYRELELLRLEAGAAAIAVAHTADDQVEEFFLRLIRGTGRKGLSGMAVQHGKVVRPLLHVRRQTLLDYLLEHDVGYCHDSSNDDMRFLRNRVRHRLLPELEQSYTPAIRDTVLRTCSILATEDDFLHQQSEIAFTSTSTVLQPGRLDEPAGIVCDRSRFAILHPALQRRVIERICWHLGNGTSYRQITTLQNLITAGQSGSSQHLKSGLHLELVGNQAYFSHPAGQERVRGKHVHPPPCRTEVAGCGEYSFPTLQRQLIIRLTDQIDPARCAPSTIAVNGDLLHFPFVVRSPLPGEKIRPLGAPGKKKIARILTDAKIPRSQRPTFLLVEQGGEPAAILGLAPAEEYKVTENCNTTLLLTWKEQVS